MCARPLELSLYSLCACDKAADRRKYLYVLSVQLCDFKNTNKVVICSTDLVNNWIKDPETCSLLFCFLEVFSTLQDRAFLNIFTIYLSKIVCIAELS